MDTNHTVLIRGRSIWDKELMPASEFEERVAKIRSRMAAAGLDALLVYGDAYCYGSLCYVSGFIPKTRDGIVILPKDEQPVLVASSGSRDLPFITTLTWQGDVRATMKIVPATVACLASLGLSGASLGLVGAEERMAATNFEALQKALLEAKLVEATSIIDEMRIAKSWRELKVIQEAAQIVSDAMAFARDRVRPGIAEYELLAEVERFARYRGVEDFRFLIAPAATAAYGLRTAGERRIEPNDTLLIYLAASYLRYWAEIGRTVGLNRQSALVDVVTGAQRRIVNDIRPGVVARKTIDGARDLLSKAGAQAASEAYGFGNGIGLDAHEKPVLAPDESRALVPGMVLSVRAGSYKVGEGGAFVSDVVAVTKSGCQVLTR